MKKKFTEPQIRRIEMNLNENIASSMSIFPFVFKMYDYSSCTVWETGKYMWGGLSQAEWDSCYVGNVGGAASDTAVMSVDLNNL